MSMEMEFYLKMLATFIISGIIWIFMEKAQKRKEEEAARKCDETLRMIELRNRTYDGGKDESKKTP